MKYLHTMLRVTDLEASLHFYGDALGLEITRRGDVPAERFTLVYLAPPGQPEAEIELTHIGIRRFMSAVATSAMSLTR